MLVDGSGQLKMTKDGKVLLSEMQIQVSPTSLFHALPPPFPWSMRCKRAGRSRSLGDREYSMKEGDGRLELSSADLPSSRRGGETTTRGALSFADSSRWTAFDLGAALPGAQSLQTSVGKQRRTRDAELEHDVNTRQARTTY